jgi:hypothetical protein
MRCLHWATTLLTILSLLLLPSLQLKMELNSYSVEIASSLYAAENGSQGGTFQGKKADESGTMALLTMAAVALVTAGLAVWCSNKPTDVWLAIAAGVAYIGGEAYSMMSMKKLKYKSIEYDGTQGDPAVQTLRDEKKSYQDLLKIAKTKKMFIMAAAAGYTAAAAMAATLVAETTASAGTTAAKNVAQCGVGDEITKDQAALQDQQKLSKAEAQEAAELNEGHGCDTNLTTCPTELGIEKMKTFNLVMMQLKIKVQKFIKDPMNRTILFGGFAAIAYMAMKAVEKMIKTLEENIERIDQILANLKDRAKDSKSVAAGGGIKLQGISMIQVVPLEELEKLGMHKLAKKLPCVKKINGKCVSVAASIKNDQRTISLLGSNFAGAANLIGSISDNIQGSQEMTQGLLDDAAKLAGKGAMLRRKLKEIRKLVNNKEIRQGQKPTNFAVQEKKLNKGIFSSVDRALRNAGTSAGAILGTGSISSSKKDANKAKKEAKLQGPKMGGGKALSAARHKPQFDFALDEDEGSGTTEFGDDVPSPEDFDITAQDIEQRPDVSIFEQISVRYIRTGIPRLFEKSAAEIKK